MQKNCNSLGSKEPSNNTPNAYCCPVGNNYGNKQNSKFVEEYFSETYHYRHTSCDKSVLQMTA